MGTGPNNPAGFHMENKNQLLELFGSLLKERGIPRSLKESLEKSINILNGNEPMNSKVTTITSMLDEMSYDQNISQYARTQIWNIVSELENITKN